MSWSSRRWWLEHPTDSYADVVEGTCSQADPTKAAFEGAATVASGRVPTNRVSRILAGVTAVTPDTALRLAWFFDTSPESCARSVLTTSGRPKRMRRNQPSIEAFAISRNLPRSLAHDLG